MSYLITYYTKITSYGIVSEYTKNTITSKSPAAWLANQLTNYPNAEITLIYALPISTEEKINLEKYL